MISQTAHATVSIQYPSPICTPHFEECHVPIEEEKPYIIWLFDFRPEALIRTPTFILPRWAASPRPFTSEEFLRWDSPVETVPKRPSGEISVTLKYLGRATPIKVTEYWD